MKTAPKLQQFITQLAARHHLDWRVTGAYLCVELATDASGERLILANLGTNRIRLACQLYLFDGWVDEPAIVLWTAAPAGWAPIEVEQIQSGWQGYAALDPQGELEDFYDPLGQAALADFAEDEVVVNLLTQGWLINSRPVKKPKRLSGCQSDHTGPCYGELWQCAACGKTVCYAEGTDHHPELCDDCWVKRYGNPKEVDDVPF